jgi:hypothetical protein
MHKAIRPGYALGIFADGTPQSNRRSQDQERHDRSKESVVLSPSNSATWGSDRLKPNVIALTMG